MEQLSGCGDLALMRRRDVEKVTGLSKPGIYKMIREGRFPEPVKLSVRLVVWRAADLRRWLEDPAGWRDAQRISEPEPESA